MTAEPLPTDEEIEAYIAAKKLEAPRITKDHIQQVLDGSEVLFHVFPTTATTVCCIVLPSRYTVIGKSACVSMENFDAKLGRRLAYKDAAEQIWGLEAYLLAVVVNEAGDDNAAA